MFNLFMTATVAHLSAYALQAKEGRISYVVKTGSVSSTAKRSATNDFKNGRPV